MSRSDPRLRRAVVERHGLAGRPVASSPPATQARQPRVVTPLLIPFVLLSVRLAVMGTELLPRTPRPEDVGYSPEGALL
jgi:hypothetical protein